ncbi:S-adenosyl-L-homocysteine hydrolase [Aeriscardovia aeriphila]|uniref:S-adenosyl-L-homocysteine hydrolase n=2 Tax=Aeriscardovia aeriphila TaxID=218139 RepID=A0A261F8B8_9BIFI|nr:S-adenosyl-L-homocysteine hydrolase [Aeriscardovia aeriphila]
MRVSAAEKLNELKALDARRLLGTLKSLKHTQPTIPFVIPTFSPGLIPMVSPVSSAFDNAAGNTSATGNTSVADFPSFASWAQYVSSHTNRSLAGNVLPSQIFTTEESRLAAHNWGIILSDHASHQVSQAHNLTSDLVHPDYDVRALSGKDAMDYAQAHMPVSAGLLEQLQAQGLNLHGVRIAACLILEPKTAVLLRLLKKAGAQVGVYCGPSSTDQRVADQLKAEGIIVEADSQWTNEEAHEAALRLLDELHPDVIIDDGASFARLAALERPELIANLRGVAEETTSGVRAFQAMQDAHALTFPVIAVNDSQLKTGFDNSHGTGETCVTTLQTLLGSDCFAGQNVTVVGYGPVGRGFAMRARALGAHVSVCDVDPVAALKAAFDGFAAVEISSVLPTTDMLVSATGVRHTVTVEHLQSMKNNAIVTVIGGIANEIALDDLGFTLTHRPVEQLKISTTHTLRLISGGDGVNYTAGGGNPIEIMDLSFAVQISAVHALLTSSFTPGLHRLGADADQRIARLALAARGFSVSSAVADNGYNWTMTRFAEAQS